MNRNKISTKTTFKNRAILPGRKPEPMIDKQEVHSSSNPTLPRHSQEQKNQELVENIQKLVIQTQPQKNFTKQFMTGKKNQFCH